MRHPITTQAHLPPLRVIDSAQVSEPFPIDPDQLALILAEAEASDQRAISEVEGAAPLAIVPCEHHAFSARRTLGTSWDDHTTQWGQCLSCRAWVVFTYWRDGRDDEVRPMTERELSAMQEIDDRYRRIDAL